MPAVYTRARFGEDRLEIAVRQGVGQYVIIGAGYETLAMRRADLMTRLVVYELDQAATQETKRRRMRKAGIPTPARLRYVAADLNTENLDDALDRAGFDAARPALFSWFGVTYYLGEDAIRQTLRSIAAKMAPGSSVMFDYLAALESTPAAARGLRKRCADFVARRGEPWISSFSPTEIPDFLTRMGYSEIDNLEPNHIGPHYFSRHPDLVYPPLIGLCHAGHVNRLISDAPVAPLRHATLETLFDPTWRPAGVVFAITAPHFSPPLGSPLPSAPARA